VYDPATNTWETKTSMPTARSWLTANVVNGKIYLMGGYPDITLNEVYDPATDSWTTKTPAPNTLIFGFDKPASAVIDNKIYVIGGISQDQSYDLNQIYDAETDTWSQGVSPITSVDGGAAAATTGVLAPKRIYVLGNSANFRQGEEQNFVRVYDPETDSWTFGSDAPTRRYNFGVAVINDTLYAIGGHTYSYIPGNYEPLAVNEQYTPIGYIPEFPSWTLLVAGLFVVTFVSIIYRRGFKWGRRK
jgi:N-acetylneuraminic acid mutarotase